MGQGCGFDQGSTNPLVLSLLSPRAVVPNLFGGYENLMPDDLQWSWSGDASTREGQQIQMKLSSLDGTHFMPCSLVPTAGQLGTPVLEDTYSQTFKKNWFSRKMCHVYTEASSTPCEPLGCVLLKLRSIDPKDPDPLRFYDHLFIHTIRSLIHNPEEPQVSGWNWVSSSQGNNLFHLLMNH